jgi:hypothetical protein
VSTLHRIGVDVMKAISKFRCCGFSLMGLLLQVGSSAASDQSPNTTLETIASSIAAYFSEIRSIQYSVQRTALIEESLALEAGTESKSDGLFLYDGTKYRIENRLGIGKWARLNRIITNDGFSYRVYHYHFDRLVIQDLTKNPHRDSEFPLRYSNPFIMPFEFLSHALLDDDLNEFSLGELKGITSSKGLLSRLISITENKERKLVVAEFRASDEIRTSLPSRYRVYFSIDHNFFPVRWERIADNGRIIFDYSITKLGVFKTDTNPPLFYPEEARWAYFGGHHGQEIQSQPFTLADFSINIISLNRPIDEDMFTIDPMIGSTIWDKNSGALISVPR